MPRATLYGCAGPTSIPNLLFNVLVLGLTETTRHAGRADILREGLDGMTGDPGDADEWCRTVEYWKTRWAKIDASAEENGQVAVVAAEIETERGTYAGIGDASLINVARPMVLHLLRLAETRATAQAPRDAVNAGVAALEV